MDRFEQWLLSQIDKAESGKKQAFERGEPIWLVTHDSGHKLLMTVLHAYRSFKRSESTKDRSDGAE